VNPSILHHQEEKEMTKLFHIKIKVNALFDSSSHVNLIVVNLVSKLALEV
jgi:hypothetical protein